MRERRLGYAAMWLLVLGAWFSLVFYGADWITAHRPRHVVPYFAWELQLPFIPSLAVVYLTMNLLIAIALVALGTRRELRALALALCADILIAGVGFILYPAQLAFPEPLGTGTWAMFFHFADRLNGDYNLVPSLHVALAVTCVSAYATRAKPLWWLWATAIAASTLLTHQHHVIDVVTGWLLGIAGGRLYRGMNQSQL
jgi:membrane-associated phospholipid phosphatase